MIKDRALRSPRLPATSIFTSMCCANGCASCRPIRSMRFPVMADEAAAARDRLAAQGSGEAEGGARHPKKLSRDSARPRAVKTAGATLALSSMGSRSFWSMRVSQGCAWAQNRRQRCRVAPPASFLQMLRGSFRPDAEIATLRASRGSALHTHVKIIQPGSSAVAGGGHDYRAERYGARSILSSAVLSCRQGEGRDGDRRKIAVLFYNTLSHGMTYRDQRADHYEEQYRSRVLAMLKRRANSLVFVLQAVPSDTEAAVS